MRGEYVMTDGWPGSRAGDGSEQRESWREVILPGLFRDLPLLRLEFVLQAEESVELPSFLGSTLRGAFGHALKRSACQSSGTACQTCSIPLSCWYGWLFETVSPGNGSLLRDLQDAPRPFILTPPLAGQVGSGQRLRKGERVTFSMSLLGGAVNGLAFAVYGIEEMARAGLGVRRGLFSLREVFCLDVSGQRISLGYNWRDRQLDLLKTEVVSLEDLVVGRLQLLPAGIDRLKVRFLTRARIRVDGALQDSIGFPDLIRFLWRRVSLLLEVHGSGHPPINRNGMMGDADAIRTLASATVRHDVWRSSNRQRRRLHQDGFLGESIFEGEDLESFLPLLAAGELLHVGSGATFGLGKYEITI